MKNLFGSLLYGINIIYEKAILRMSLVRISMSGQMGMQSTNKASMKIFRNLIQRIEVYNFKS